MNSSLLIIITISFALLVSYCGLKTRANITSNISSHLSKEEHLLINCVAVFASTTYCVFCEDFFRYDDLALIPPLFVSVIILQLTNLQNKDNNGIIICFEDLSGILLFVSLIVCPTINVLWYTAMFCWTCYWIGDETESDILVRLQINRTRSGINFFVSLFIAIIDFAYNQYSIINHSTRLLHFSISLLIIDIVLPYVVDKVTLVINNNTRHFQAN